MLLERSMDEVSELFFGNIMYEIFEKECMASSFTEVVK